VVKSGDFVRAGVRCNLKDTGRMAFIRAYERRMDTLITHPVFGYRISYRRVLDVQARLLARFVSHEIAEYPEFTTR
jgi:CRISPR-associated protein Cas1